MPRSSSSKSSSKSTSFRGHSRTEQQDALDILADDHKRVMQMFDEFKKMKEDNDPDDEARQYLVESTCAELSIHAQVEEELFYPALRNAIDDLDLLDEAEVEHASAKQLITELAAMQAEDDLYDAKFTVLGEYVKHHIHEEEKKIFPKAKKSDIDLEDMGDEIRQRKIELRDELGIVYGRSTEEDEEPAAKSKPGRRVH